MKVARVTVMATIHGLMLGRQGAGAAPGASSSAIAAVQTQAKGLRIQIQSVFVVPKWECSRGAGGAVHLRANCYSLWLWAGFASRRAEKGIPEGE